MKEVVVIDYGIVNIKNIVRGLEFVGGKVKVSREPKEVEGADRVVLPGVGAFHNGMRELCELGLDEAIRDVASSGRPILGICLGMQMLLNTSVEYGQHQGLGLISGSVVPIPTYRVGVGMRKVPHVGWNALIRPIGTNWQLSCLLDTNEKDFFYFSHSFMAELKDDKNILAKSSYQGLPIVSAVKRDNITGLQFHPERSASSGLAVLRNFLNSD